MQGVAWGVKDSLRNAPQLLSWPPTGLAGTAFGLEKRVPVYVRQCLASDEHGSIGCQTIAAAKHLAALQEGIRW